MKQKLFVPSKLFLLQWNSFSFFICVRRCSFTTHITALYCSQRSKQRQPQSGCLEIQPTSKGPVWFVPWEMRGWQICEVSGAFYHQVSAAANCSIKGLLTGSVLTTPSSADELLLQMLHDLQKLNKCNVCSSLFAIEEHRGTFFWLFSVLEIKINWKQKRDFSCVQTVKVNRALWGSTLSVTQSFD